MLIGVEEPIRAVGAKLRHFPGHSPGLNPVEMVFRQLKAPLRKLAKRTIEDVNQCIGSFIRAFGAAQSASHLECLP